MNAWKIGVQVAVNFNTTEVPAYHSITEEGIEVARVTIYPHGGQQAKERATLMASAPSLLGALQGLGTHPEFGYCFCLNRKQQVNGHTGECQEARAAIAGVEEIT